ncbi:hypothetical protein HDU98_003561, partial [Podochytrium sp. JEL0797]
MPQPVPIAPIREQLDQMIAASPDLSLTVATVKVLYNSISTLPASTLSELTRILMSSSDRLKQSSPKNYSVLAGCEAFMRQVQLTEDVSADACCARLKRYVEDFEASAAASLEKIAKCGVGLIK